MANIEERIRRVLKGLMLCGSNPEWLEDCESGGCPYVDADDGECVSMMCRDAYGLIVELDRLLQQHQEAADAGTSSDPAASGATFPKGEGKGGDAP